MTRVLRPGDLAVDATMGNGHDTERMARLVGPEGRVFAFDIQAQALEKTRLRLTEAGLADRVTLIRDSHANMAAYVDCPPKLAAFNLGFLPGGDKAVTTLLDSTLAAVRTAMELLQPGGMLLVCCYPGHDEGQRELDALRTFFAAVPPQMFNVLEHVFVNAGPGAPVCFAAEKQAFKLRRSFRR
ncbi:MAG: methyltransferase domain-containing protein [Clostridia bacterium]|nr:methyltransferase domain-containing protein [Clostridia bacterium]